MENLIIIKNKHNDKGSSQYLKAIRKQWKENYQDDINLIIWQIEHQEDLEQVLNTNKGKVLLLDPTSLYIPEYRQDRNAEQHQTAMFVCDTVRYTHDTLNTKVLIVGKGIIGKKIFDELCIKNGYCCTMYGSQYNISEEFSQQFDIIINTVSQGTDINMYANCDILFDIAGSFKPQTKKISCGTCPRSGHIEYAEVKSSIDSTYDISDIGMNTVYRLLEEIKNGGR